MKLNKICLEWSMWCI